MSAVEKEVRARLQRLRLSEAEREDVFAEIVTHLELVVDELTAAGIDEQDARREALFQLGDEKRLLKRIQRERTSAMRMRESFRRIWLPSAAVVCLTYWSQMVIYRFIAEPHAYHILGTYYATNWLWLATVICTGAFGAWWSRRLGATVRQRIVVALAPAEAMAIVIAVVLPIGMSLEAIVQRRMPYALSHPMIMLGGILWMLHSAVPSLVGALPFLIERKAQPREVVS